MLFRKTTDRRCAVCARAVRLGESEMLCEKKGVVSPLHRCIRFRYDPCKRIPKRPPAVKPPEESLRL
ncbi:MAG: hypothetical protein GX633_08905 [Clostridiales bacterium]|jgi:hypothetical protein|nr:hypothetical protein [Clostridiales bacterium]